MTHLPGGAIDTCMANATPGTVTYRRADSRWYVDVDGRQAGWVYRDTEGTWTFVAPVRQALTGERLAAGYRTRREAVREGLGVLRTRHSGAVYRLNLETIRDDLVVIPRASLLAAEERLRSPE